MNETLQDRLDALAEELSSRGLTEQGDFYVLGRPDLQVGSSEYIGLESTGGRFDVFYSDMGRRRSLLATSDFEEARELFVRESLDLGRQRGRRVTDPGSRAEGPPADGAAVRRALALAGAGGARLDLIVAGEVVDRIPVAPSHRWVVFPTSDGQLVVGGMDRGAFSAYSVMDGPEAAAEVLIRWTTHRPSPAPRPADVLRAAAATVSEQLVELEHRHDTVARGGSLTARVLPVGCPLDHIGTTSGHVLYLYDTSLSARSLPPTDVGEDRLGFVLDAPLPDTCTISRIAPWFGQPGGGWMVVLDRVIAYYCDTGTLLPFGIATGEG